MKRMKYVAAAAGVVAGVAIGLSGAAGASTAGGQVCTVNGVPFPATEHVIPKGATLAGWDLRHHAFAGDVLAATAECGPGYQQLELDEYVNAGNWNAKFSVPVAVWVPRFVRLPPPA